MSAILRDGVVAVCSQGNIGVTAAICDIVKHFPSRWLGRSPFELLNLRLNLPANHKSGAEPLSSLSHSPTTYAPHLETATLAYPKS